MSMEVEFVCVDFYSQRYDEKWRNFVIVELYRFQDAFNPTCGDFKLIWLCKMLETDIVNDTIIMFLYHTVIFCVFEFYALVKLCMRTIKPNGLIPLGEVFFILR